MGVFRYLDRWQGSIRDIWNREDQTDRLMALLEQRDRDLEDWLAFRAIDAPATSLNRSGAQSIPNNTLTAVTWDVEAYDAFELHSQTSNTSRITVPASYGGLWRFGYSLDFAANAAGVRLAYLNRNGALVRYAANESVPAAGVNTTFTGTVELRMAVGDYVELIVYQNSGGALNAGTNGHFWGSYVSP